MILPPPIWRRLLPARGPVRVVAFSGASAFLFCVVFTLFSVAWAQVPVLDWFVAAIEPGVRVREVPGRPDVWLLPALELVSVVLLGWRAVAVREER